MDCYILLKCGRLFISTYQTLFKMVKMSIKSKIRNSEILKRKKRNLGKKKTEFGKKENGFHMALVSEKASFLSSEADTRRGCE